MFIFSSFVLKGRIQKATTMAIQPLVAISLEKHFYFFYNSIYSFPFTVIRLYGTMPTCYTIGCQWYDTGFG